LRSLRIKRSASEHYDLNPGVVLRSTSRNNPGARFIGVYDYIAVVAKCLWREAESDYSRYLRAVLSTRGRERILTMKELWASTPIGAVNKFKSRRRNHRYRHSLAVV